MPHLTRAFESVPFKKSGYVIYKSAHNLQIYQVFVLFLYDKVENMTDLEDKLMPKMAEDGIHAGFPSPATDYMTQAIDLNRELVKHPAATFYGRVVGDSMIDAGVEEGDILVIDKALEAQDGDMAVCPAAAGKGFGTGGGSASVWIRTEGCTRGYSSGFAGTSGGAGLQADVSLAMET